MFETLTDLGDATLIVPASFILIVYFWTVGSHRVAVAWLASLSSCVLLLLLSKICFGACSELISALHVRSPSGHAGLAAMFYGSGALLLGRGYARPLRIGLALSAGALVAGIAVSRFVLGFHSPAEIVIGLMIGFVAIAVFSALASSASNVQAMPRAALALYPVLAVLSHGQHIDAEQWIAQLSGEFRGTINVCNASSPSSPTPATPSS